MTLDSFSGSYILTQLQTELETKANGLLLHREAK